MEVRFIFQLKIFENCRVFLNWSIIAAIEEIFIYQNESDWITGEKEITQFSGVAYKLKKLLIVIQFNLFLILTI